MAAWAFPSCRCRESRQRRVVSAVPKCTRTTTGPFRDGPAVKVIRFLDSMADLPWSPGWHLKGIVLAGGTGSRLFPLTKVTNKHLLPVGTAPMLWHPLWKLKQAGAEEILIVTGTEHMGDIVGCMGSGKDFGCRFTYKVQDEAGGIAQALALAENFAGGSPICVILGDNIFQDDLKAEAEAFLATGPGRPGHPQACGGSPALRRGGRAGGTRGGDRGEAQEPEVQPGRDRDLFLRRAGLRHHPSAEALRARRDGDHRRQQRLHRAGASSPSGPSRAGGRMPAPSRAWRTPTSWPARRNLPSRSISRKV